MAMHSGLALLLLLPLLPVLLVLVRRKGKKQEIRGLKPRLPPGPPRLPIIGNLHQLGALPHRKLWELSEKYGPLMHLQLGCVSTVIVSSAQTAKEVLKTHDLQACNRPVTAAGKRLSYNFSDMGLSPYNEMWRQLKKISVLKLLCTKKVEDLRPLREREVARMMSSISTLVSHSKPVNISKLSHSLSNSITCSAIFGRSLLCGEQQHRRNTLNRIFDDNQKLFVEMFFAEHIPWAGWVDVLSGLRGRLEKSFVGLDDFFEEVIEEHLSTSPAEGEKDFLDVLLRLQSEDGFLTRDHIKGLLMNLLGAGIDTSSSTAVFAVAELVRHPDCMRKAQEEVRKVVGKKGTVEESDIPHLNYLKLVVKETLRLHPVVPLLLPHETTEHFTINGYDVPPKTRVLVNAWAIGREKASWDKPDEFIPERFLGSTIDYKGHDFQFIPFGAGRRICPGMTFGLSTMKLELANLLYSFDWEVPGGLGKVGIDMTEQIGVSLRLKANLELLATKYEH